MVIPSPLHHLLDFCYPPACAACNAPAIGRLCDNCLHDLATLELKNRCVKCACPCPIGSGCSHCEDQGIATFESIHCLGNHEGPLRKLLQHLKFHGHWPIVDLFAGRCIEHRAMQAMLKDVDLIVPVPLHPFRQLSRGYNQSHLVARSIARHSRVQFATPLVRLKNTAAQTRVQSREKRRENLRGAFGLLSPRAIRDRRILVIDDVMTTGATLAAVAQVLDAAEPACVRALVIARADPRGRAFEVA